MASYTIPKIGQKVKVNSLRAAPVTICCSYAWYRQHNTSAFFGRNQNQLSDSMTYSI